MKTKILYLLIISAIAISSCSNEKAKATDKEKTAHKKKENKEEEKPKSTIAKYPLLILTSLSAVAEIYDEVRDN